MSEKSCFRMRFHKQYGKRAQTLLQSGWRSLNHIYWSIWTWFSWKKSRLVLCKILRLFVNTLTADDKYSLLNRDNLMQPIQMQLSLKQKAFSQFLLAFSKSTLNSANFQTKMTLIAYVFRIWQTPKNMITYMS